GRQDDVVRHPVRAVHADCGDPGQHREDPAGARVRGEDQRCLYGGVQGGLHPTGPDLMTTLQLSGISKNFGAVAALTDVDLTVDAGQVVAIVGDNGAGKSTLVKVLSGVHAPDAGTSAFEGREVASP